MIRINLVPAAFLAKQKQQHRVLQVGAVTILSLVIISGISFMHMSEAKRVRTELEEKKAEMAVLQTIIDQVNLLKKEKATINTYLTAIKELSKIRLVYTRFMQDLIKSMPDGVRFNSLKTKISKDAKTLDFNIPSMSNSAENLIEWIHTLNNSTDTYKNVVLGAISITKSDMGKQFSFPIKATYIVPEKNIKIKDKGG